MKAAQSDSAPRREPLTARACAWGTLYNGTREQLVDQAGIPAHLFDALGPGRRKTEGVHDGREVKIRQTSEHRFTVWLHFNAAEQAAADERGEVERKLAADRRAADRARAAWPKSAREFRDQHMTPLAKSLDWIRGAVAGYGAGGWLLDDESRDEVDRALAIIRTAAEHGRIVFDEHFREANERVIAVDHSRDPKFAALLNKLGARCVSSEGLDGGD